MRILGIDPGPIESAWCLLDGDKVEEFGKCENDSVCQRVKYRSAYDCLVVEMPNAMGMPVGADVLETCVWVGVFDALSNSIRSVRITRNALKYEMCGKVAGANDAAIRQRLIDLFGGPNAKKKGGPLYGMSKDCWQALAVAVAYRDNPSCVYNYKEFAAKQVEKRAAKWAKIKKEAKA